MSIKMTPNLPFSRLVVAHFKKTIDFMGIFACLGIDLWSPFDVYWAHSQSHDQITDKEESMAERMTKSEMMAEVAKKTGLKKKDVAMVLDEFAQLAYKEAKNTFQVPGLGIIVMRERPARKMTMRFGPKAGQEIEVPAKKVLKFRFSKPAKDAILGS